MNKLNQWEKEIIEMQKVRYKSDRKIFLYYENLIDKYKDAYKKMIDYKKYFERGMKDFTKEGLEKYLNKIEVYRKAMKRVREKYPEYAV